MNETSKAFAFITVTIRSIIVIIGFFGGLFLAVKGVNGADALTGLLFLGLVQLVLEWFAVINADHSQGWAITLLILAVLLIINFNFISIICGIIYIVYSIKCLQLH